MSFKKNNVTTTYKTQDPEDGVVYFIDVIIYDDGVPFYEVYDEYGLSVENEQLLNEILDNFEDFLKNEIQ